MDLLLAGALASNFVFGVAIVICNKTVVALDGFNFIVVLTLCHFLFTLLACIIMAKGRVFVPKHLPWTKRLCLSSVGAWGRTRRFSSTSEDARSGIQMRLRFLTSKLFSHLRAPFLIHIQASLGSIVFMNLNLAHNSVGFYQLSKLMCIPVIIVAEYWGYGKFPSSATIAAVAAIAMGVAAVGATDVSVDLAGLALAAVAVLTTSIGQILCSHYQKELECDPMQLLYSTCPIVTLGLIGMVPVFHDTEALRVLRSHPSW